MKKVSSGATAQRVLLGPSEVGRILSRMPAVEPTIALVKRRYSVTADILSYLRCKRQYGFFARRGYTSAQSGQLFFGTVIHETLDRLHAHFRGELEGVPAGSMPTDRDVEAYFAIAEKSLRSRGIRPLSRESRDKAREYVNTFNQSYGETVYPRIVDTEHKLQKDKGAYVLHGVVDVVAESSGRSRDAGRWEEYEIWDYKGSKFPQGRDLINYEFQMRVYAHLYQLRNGTPPNTAVLWFLGENERSKQRYSVSLSRDEVDRAVAIFEGTVAAIEESIVRDDWSKITKDQAPSPETCDACDLRWKCPAPAKPFRLRAL